MDGPFHYPPVSVVIPSRDAADGLRIVLPAILAQKYEGRVEVIVADGSRTKETVEMLRQCFPMVQIVLNPERVTSTGINWALTRATGEIVVRCDAYAVLPPNYIQRAVETLIRTGACNVGGRQHAVGGTFIERAIALGQNIPLGVGNAFYRLDRGEGPTDTVYLGVFRRDVLKDVGNFDPTLLRNEDYEINWQIRAAGGIVWYNPTLVVNYKPRGTFRSLMKQYFDYGRWKRLIVGRYPRSIRVRQVIPPVLLLGLAVSAVGLWIDVSLWASAVPLVYILVLLGETVRVGVRYREPAAVFLPLVLLSIHLSWGAGFFCPPSTIRKRGSVPIRRPFSRKATARTPQHLFPSEARFAGLPMEQAWSVEQEGALEISAEGAAKADSHISVVILTWNSVGKIESCLEALGQEARVHDEIIVVDNGSKDQTQTVLATRFPSVRVVENITNQGVARARNQGLMMAQGEYVLVLDDDTIIQPEAIARMVSVLDTHPTVGMCGPQLLDVARWPIEIGLRFPTISDKVRSWRKSSLQNDRALGSGTFDRVREVDYVVGACQLVRRAALDEIGGYDEHIFYGPEDIDLCLRLRRAGWQVVCQPAAQVIHAEQRIARSILSRIGWKHMSGLLHYFWKHRYGLSRKRASVPLPTSSPASRSH